MLDKVDKIPSKSLENAVADNSSDDDIAAKLS